MATENPGPRRRLVPREQRLGDVVREASRLFDQKGYEQTSVDELASAMGVSVGSLYRFVRTKSDALVMVCDDIYEGLPEELTELTSQAGSPAEALTTVVRRYLVSCVEHRRLILLLYREFRHLPPEAQLRSQRKEDAIVAVLASALRGARPRLRPRDAQLLASNIVLVGHLPALKGWQLKASGIRLEAFVDQQTAVLTDAFVRGD